MKCDVIVTYCWNRVGYNILRSLSSKGLSVWVADTSKINICSVSKFCEGSFTYPDPFKEEEAFIACLLTKIEDLKPRMLLPTHDESVIIMKHRDRFPSDLIIPYENEEKLLKLANKAHATKLACDASVPTPVVYNDKEEVSDYPIVFKTVVGNSAKGVYFPKNIEELHKCIKIHQGEETMIEEWIEGTDYSVDCIRWNGFWQASVYHALVTKTDGGGTTTQREIVALPVLEKYAKMFLEHVDFSGVCGLDFRFDSVTGKCAFIEVNARFTGGLATPIAAGFDIPFVIWKLATDGVYDEQIDVRIGTKTKWILGDVITLVGRLLSFKFSKSEMRRVFNLRGFDAFDDYRKDDKRAFFGQLIYYFSKLVRNFKLNP